MSPTQNQSPAPQPHQPDRPRVIIVGAGFGGLSAARTLAHSEVDVLLLDQNNYHGFWPLLYQVATAGLEPESVAYPVRAIFRTAPNVRFFMTVVQGVDFADQMVQTENGPIPYDYLVLAAGSTSHYFGNDKLAHYTYGLKDIDEAEALRNHILACFEQAAHEPQAERRRALLTFVLVGGGPTGVELAGAIAELLRHVIQNDFPDLNLAETTVLLVEGLDRLLMAFHPTLAQDAKQRLETMGVQVRLNTLVTDADETQVTFQDGSTQPAHTIIWTAGVRGASLSDNLDVPQEKSARIRVTSTLNLPGHTNVFVIGDMAHLEGYRTENQPHPMLAPVAIQQGTHAAHTILAQLRGKPPRAFIYADRGAMATIGRRSAVVDAFGIRLTGFLAWLGWLFVHLMELVGFRNRLVVLINWAYNYFTYDRGVRIITRRDCR